MTHALQLALAAALLVPVACDNDSASATTPGAGGKADNADDNDPCASHDSDADEYEACLILHGLAALDIEGKQELRIDPGLLAGESNDNGAFAPRFCTATDGQLKLDNAALLAFVASNVYASPRALAPVLSSLGFGDDNDLFWGHCYADLARLYELEAQWADDPSSLPNEYDGGTEAGLARELTVCGRAWYEDEHDGSSDIPAQGLGAQFEAFLLQTADPDSRLQFFSGGKFDVADNAFEPGSTQVVWMEHNERPLAILGFRGTEPSSMLDIMVDVRAGKSTLADFEHWGTKAWGRVHSGFRRASTATAGIRLLETIDALQARNGKPVEIWLTGHSLGGALGTVFASVLLEKLARGDNLDAAGDPRWTLGGLYTFGSPRVGDGTFKRRLEQLAAEHGTALFRFRNHDDLVTRTPVFGYEHVGELVYFDDDGTLHVQPDSIDEPWVGSAGDHRSRVYFSRVRAAGQDPTLAGHHGC